MKLILKNIAKIKAADVELNGITVIAGENDTGKSTVGKALYSVFNSMYNVGGQIHHEKVRSIANAILSYYTMQHGAGVSVHINLHYKEIDDRFMSGDMQLDVIESGLMEMLHGYRDDEDVDRDTIENTAKRIKDIIGVPDEEIFKTILLNNLRSEFGDQINNIYNEQQGSVELIIKNNAFSVMLSGDRVETIDNFYSLNTEAVYLDDPFILDELGWMSFSGKRSRYANHENDVINKLSRRDGNTVVDEIIAGNKLKRVYAEINSVCGGSIVLNKRYSAGYKINDSDKMLNVKNMSAGLKTFMILKTLLENGTIRENGMIILDEPEIHLHPQWQLLFAEIIVLLQKEFDMNILLNTHSPYFMKAIEVYSAKYEIADKCKYYLAHTEDDRMSVIEDVTNEPEKIYRLLARPLQDLENVRYEDD